MCEMAKGIEALRFLIVEDHSFQRQVLAMTLDSLGAGEVRIAENGDEAMRIIRNSSPPDIAPAQATQRRKDVFVQFDALPCRPEDFVCRPCDRLICVGGSKDRPDRLSADEVRPRRPPRMCRCGLLAVPAKYTAIDQHGRRGRHVRREPPVE